MASQHATSLLSRRMTDVWHSWKNIFVDFACFPRINFIQMELAVMRNILSSTPLLFNSFQFRGNSFLSTGHQKRKLILQRKLCQALKWLWEETSNDIPLGKKNCSVLQNKGKHLSAFLPFQIKTRYLEWERPFISCLGYLPSLGGDVKAVPIYGGR